MPLDAQAILVVGGGQGIGLETVRAIFAKSPPSTQAVVFDLNVGLEVQSLAKQYSGRLFPIQGDVTSASDRARALDECVARLGGLDTVVYTAGVITPIERIESLDMDAVQKTYAVNVFGTMGICQLALPHLRRSRVSNPLNAAFGKILILSSACDADVTYSGWMPYCTTKAALTRFIQLLAHEEPLVSVQGVYPKLTRTQMPKDVIVGKYKGVMADHEVERFRIWDEVGDEMVEPAAWCGEAVAKLAVGLYAGGKSGETLYYDEHVPKKIVGT